MARTHAAEMVVRKGPLVRVTTRYCSGVPGCARQFDPTTAVVQAKVAVARVPVRAAKLRRAVAGQTAEGEAQLSRSRRHLVLTMGRFPFQSQNRLAAAQLLRDLIAQARTSVAPHPTREAADCPQYMARRRRRPVLAFPAHWLSPPAAGCDGDAHA